VWVGLAVSATARRVYLEEEGADKAPTLSVDEAVSYVFRAPPEIGAIILGPPGIGKTELVLEYARREAEGKGKEFILLNDERRKRALGEFEKLVLDILKHPERYYVVTVVSFGAVTPDDLLGVPRLVTVRDGDKLLAVFEESALKACLALLTVKDIHGLLLIDDALNANDNVRRSFLVAVFQERVVGGFMGVKLSPNVRVVATGNLVGESDLVTPLPRTMVGRAMMLRVKPAPLREWYKCMEERYGNTWFREVYAFLERYGEYYSKHSLIGDEPPTGPVPRAWSKLAVYLKAVEGELPRLLSSPEGRGRLIALVASFVGPEAASQFVAFLSKPVVSVEEALADPSRLDEIAGDLDRVLRFAVQLAGELKRALNTGSVDAVTGYLRVLVELTERTSRDIGVFVYEMLTRGERVKLRKTLLKLLARGGGVREVAEKLLPVVTGSTVASATLE